MHSEQRRVARADSRAQSVPSRGSLNAASDTVDFGRGLDTIRRHWRIIALSIVSGVALSLLYLRVAVPRYQATASVRIEARQSTLPSIYAEQAARDEVFTEIEVLRSRTIAAEVVDSLALMVQMTQPTRMAREAIFTSIRVQPNQEPGQIRIAHQKDGTYRAEGVPTIIVPGTPATINGVTFVLKPGLETRSLIVLDVLSRDETITQLRKDVDIGRAGLQASIISLQYRSEDPGLARDVLNVWTDNFIRRRQVVQRTEATNAASFIQAQLDTLMPKLLAAEDQLLAYRDANGIVAPDAEARTEVSQRALLLASRNELDAERGALAQAVARVAQQSTSAAPDAPSPYRELLGFPTLLKNQAASELLRSLSALDDQRTALLLKRTTADPDVITVTERIRSVEGQLQALTTTYLRGLTAQVEAADGSLSSANARLQAIPAQEVEYARLQRAPRVYEELVTLLQTRLQEAQITEAVQDASVRIVDQAVMPTEPASPKAPLLLALGLTGGLVMGAGLAFFREHRVHAVRSRRDLQVLTDAPVLGLIPSFTPERNRNVRSAAMGALPRGTPHPMPAAVSSPRTAGVSDVAAAEAFSRLLMNLQWTTGPMHSLLVTSPLPGDGKTTSVLHLAAAAVGQQRRVLLVDADLRCAGLTNALELRDRRGLADYVGGSAPLSEHVEEVLLPGGVRADAIGAGSLSKYASVPQVMKGIADILAHTQDYDLVLIDTPPVNIVADAAALATLTDGVILVTRSGATSPAAIDLALDQLQRAGAAVLGTVLNRAEMQRSDGYGSIEQYRAYSLARA